MSSPLLVVLQLRPNSIEDHRRKICRMVFMRTKLEASREQTGIDNLSLEGMLRIPWVRLRGGNRT